MPRYVMSICEGPDCAGNGAAELVPAAERALRECGLEAKCRVKRGGCYGLCEQGANVIVRIDDGKPVDPFASDDFDLTHEPGETHYAEMTPERIAQVVREHVGQDAPVDAFRGEPQS